ncbi:Sec-independent protein translocase subunit TatA [Brevibacterium sp. GP-SGM9]|uniref:Sec-independent protein translocase subunit TatA n=1 Tax=Brevibacterium sp. GP-SGM9 TaxID=3376990 RepID=UPI0039A6C316
MRPSFVQIAIVILIIVIIFGAPKLPQLARSLGQSMKIFKSEVKDLRDDDDSTATETKPGELGRDVSNAGTPRTDDARAAETRSAESKPAETSAADRPTGEKQDPQSHEK